MPHFDTTCYHCDAQSTGREHVPPKCLFPKGYDWPRLITVPSCVAHNNANSKADEYLKFLLGAIAADIPGAITSSAARSVIRLAQMRSSNLHRYGFQWEGDMLAIDKSFLLDFELLSTCLKKVARAIYFHHHDGQRKLLHDLQVWPLFIPIDPQVAPELALAVNEVRTLTAGDFERHPKLGSHQEVFAYQIFEELEIVRVNMEFYRAHRVSIIAAP